MGQNIRYLLKKSKTPKTEAKQNMHIYNQIQQDNPMALQCPQQTTNNKQHPKTSRKDRNKSMKIEKNPKHTPIIPEITPLRFASVKVLSFSSSCRTRSFITHNKHILFLVTPQTLLLCQLLYNQPRKNISSPKRLCSRCVSVPSSRPKKIIIITHPSTAMAAQK